MKFSKRLFTFLFTLIMVLGTITIPISADTVKFTDVPDNHWGKAYIYEMVEKGIVKGVGDNKFDPEGKVTTTQFATMLVRALHPDKLAADTKKYDTWYGSAMHIANEEGILDRTPTWYSYGVKNGTEIWVEDIVNKPMTRTQMAIMLYNCINGNYEYYSLYKTQPYTNTLPDYKEICNVYEFADIDKIIKTVCGIGIITGVDDKGTFNPNGKMTRAQACTVISRLIKFVETAEEPYEKNKWLYDESSTMLRTALTNGEPLTEENVQKLLKAQKNKAKYKHGITWTTETHSFNPTPNYGVQGCSAFTHSMLDELFGDTLNISAPYYWTIGGQNLSHDFKLRPGDTISQGNHIVIVTDVYDDYVIVAEGNYNGKVNWGRKIMLSDLVGATVDCYYTYANFD